ncbi:integrase family protein [Acinetobacter nectaris]|uniref:integrase family protein n=1 Tax=Acinetobacter nectaris TaxID=1219382 RepID=UPI001F3CBD02|nr:integrase family protein [Acinetobacter nectaris]MCF8999179.1 integrase family protein [Acinetobacter nectaris]MCF9026496.1 integrase family protein [Acinetobacter nectaris]
MNFTKPAIEKLECLSDSKPSFYWDSSTSGFGVKVTPNNKKTYIFQGRIGSTTRRITIGNVKDWHLSKAKEKAKELAVMCIQGTDPKVEKNKRIISDQEYLKTEKRKEILFKEVWSIYLEENKERWRERSYLDHLLLSKGGFDEVKKFNYKPQPIYELLNVKLSSLNNTYFSEWLQNNNYRETTASKAFRLVRAFLNWCEEDDRFQGIAPTNAIKSKKVRSKVKQIQAKKDCLLKEQLEIWFFNVLKSQNKKLSTFYICCLLTGARKEEFLSLKWDSLDFRWKTILLKDKVEDSGRTIPMTQYVEKLLLDLKQSSDSPYIFSSSSSATGYIVNPYKEFRKISNETNIQLTIHGLRRSFKSLAEWVDIPVGVTAQISGHKPSALAEKHYTVRPMDMLRGHLQKYENWVLGQANIRF